MEVKRPVEANPATACRRREPSAGDARRDGYRNTRIEQRRGCVIGATAAFSERSGPNSTVDSASVDIGNKRVGLMSILLTLFRSNVCWAKPNHAFFYCQHSFAFFFQRLVAMRPVERVQRRRAMARVAALGMQRRNDVFKKALLLCCFFFCDADMHAVAHCSDVAAYASSPQRAPPVRQLKIFYRPSLPKASHKQKCANLLRGFRPMRASACAANGMRCAPCARLDAGDAANIFHRLHAISSRPAHARNPTPRQSRRVRRCRARMPLASARSSNIGKGFDCERQPAPAGRVQRGRTHAIGRRDRRAAIATQTKKWPLQRAAIRVCDGRGAVSARRLPAARRSRPATAGR